MERANGSSGSFAKHIQFGRYGEICLSWFSPEFGMFPRAHVTLLSTRFPCLSGVLFYHSLCSCSRRLKTNYDCNNRGRLSYLL
jgi:hypothetical protein